MSLDFRRVLARLSLEVRGFCRRISLAMRVYYLSLY